MVCIASLAAHDQGRMARMGLRRALLTRRANMGDCYDAASVLRRIATPGAWPRAACVVPLPQRRRGEPSAAEIALQLARQALDQHRQRHPGFDPQAVGALIYCHSSPDARTTDSSAGRLQFELALKRACAFSVSQAHNTAALIALDMAAGLIEGPEGADTVLLVVADKLLFGRPPNSAQALVWSDVAAAAVLTREAALGWRLEAIRCGHFPTPCDTRQAWPAAVLDRFAHTLAQCLREGLEGAGLAPLELAGLIAASADPQFVARVHGLAGLPTPAGSRAAGGRAQQAACADVLAGLAGLEASVAPGQAVLLWSHGNNGEFACAVMSRIA